MVRKIMNGTHTPGSNAGWGYRQVVQDTHGSIEGQGGECTRRERLINMIFAGSQQPTWFFEGRVPAGFFSSNFGSISRLSRECTGPC